MRPPKKHIHNQKHCYWFSKWYFPHWILADLQLRLSKLWGIICSTTKSQSTSGCFKLLSLSHIPIFFGPILLWAIAVSSHWLHLLSSRILLWNYYATSHCIQSLFLRVGFCVQQTQGIYSASRSRSFSFKIQMCSAVSYFLPLAEKFQNIHIADSFSLFQIFAQVWSLQKCSHVFVAITLLDAAHGFSALSQLPCSSSAWRLNLLTL